MSCKFLFLLFFVGIPLTTMAQGVKISDDATTVKDVDASAILELAAANKGLLLPRVSDTNNIINSAQGLIVYQTSDKKIYYYNGSRWQEVGSGAAGGNTPTGNQDISQVLAVGNNAKNADMIGVDSIQARKLKISPTPLVSVFDSSYKLLAVDKNGSISPVDITSLYRGRVYKKSYEIPTSVATLAQPRDRTIYYSYKAFGEKANDVSLIYVRATSSGTYSDRNLYGDPIALGGEVNFILTIPEGVELKYLHMTSSYAAFNIGNVVTVPDTRGARIHIVYEGNQDRLEFNKLQTFNPIGSSGSYSTLEGDQGFLADFYMPIMKSVYIPSVLRSFSSTYSNLYNGAGFIEDHTIPLLQATPSDPNAYTYESSAGVTRYLPIDLTSQSQSSVNVSTVLKHPLTKFRLLYSQQNRMIIGVNHVIDLPRSSQTPAMRISMFF